MEAIQYKVKGKIVAVEKGDVLYKRVRGSIHMLYKPPAWGIDEDIFQKLKATKIRILDTDTNTIYWSETKTWTQHGFVQDRGHGLQRFLPLNHHIEKQL
jgi:hypothetical protein